MADKKRSGMIERMHTMIVDTLSACTDATVKRYYGQLSDYSKPEILKDQLPLILVDFTGDERRDTERILRFNLYFVHISYSAAEDYRQSSLSTLAHLLGSTEKLLEGIMEANIITKSSRKIFDAKIDSGYLSVFSRSIEAHLIDEGVLQWME